jgi:hypothetical protein
MIIDGATICTTCLKLNVTAEFKTIGPFGEKITHIAGVKFLIPGEPISTKIVPDA